MEDTKNDLVEIVKNQVSKLPTGVLIVAAVGGLLVLSRLKSPVAKTIIKTAVPIIAMEVLDKVFNKDRSAEGKVVEEVEAKVVE